MLIEHLPSAGWAEVATKRDLDQLRRDLEHQGALFDVKLQALEGSIVSKLTFRMMLVNAASTFTVAGVAFAAARLV